LLANPVQPGPRALSLSITPPGSHPGRWPFITCQPDSPRWFLFVLFIPLIGVLVYLIARGGSMNERSVWYIGNRTQAFPGYARQAASKSTPAEVAGESR
jgi:hypothetical protein